MEATTNRPAPVALAAVELAHEILVKALQDAEQMKWRRTADDLDAARYVLDGARMLLGRDDVNPAAFPLLIWSADADGWQIVNPVVTAVRGDANLAGCILAHIDRLGR